MGPVLAPTSGVNGLFNRQRDRFDDARRANRSGIRRSVNSVNLRRAAPRDAVRCCLAVALMAVSACAPSAEPVSFSGDHDGLTVNAMVSATDSSIVLETRVRNERDEAVQLVPDQCGRVTDVELERTEFLPEGRGWDGSIQAVKDLVLQDQGFLDRPDSFAPRRVGDSSSTVPDCSRPEHLVTLDAGGEITERWELPFQDSIALSELGSAGTLISVEAVEPQDPDELQFLDMLPFDAEQAARRGRTVASGAAAFRCHTAGPDQAGHGPELWRAVRSVDGERRTARLDRGSAGGWLDARASPATVARCHRRRGEAHDAVPQHRVRTRRGGACRPRWIRARGRSAYARRTEPVRSGESPGRSRPGSRRSRTRTSA